MIRTPISTYEHSIISPEIARLRLDELTKEEYIIWHSFSQPRDYSSREIDWKIKEICLLAARGNSTNLINYVDELGTNDKNAIFYTIARIDLLNIAQEFNVYSDTRPGDDNDNMENDIFDTIFYIYHFLQNDSYSYSYSYSCPVLPLPDSLQYFNPATGEFLGLRDPLDFIPSYPYIQINLLTIYILRYFPINFVHFPYYIVQY